MPTLYMVCVWEMPFPPVSVDVNANGSPNVYFTTECGANYVNIPDPNFKNALISKGVDTNGDNQISYAEAEVVTSLDVSSETEETFSGVIECNGGEIKSLRGIEAFRNLASLNCNCNLINSLDISSNTALTRLECGSNLLDSLDVSNNTALTVLDCFGNQLTRLDVSNNTELEYLYLSDIPTLHEVCVWELFPAGVFVDTTGSPNVYFTTNCAVNIPAEYTVNSTINIYPNPSDDIINIEIENINNSIIEIYNVNGKLVFSKAVNSKVEKIDVSELLRGIYFVKVRQDNNVRIEKLIVY